MECTLCSGLLSFLWPPPATTTTTTLQEKSRGAENGLHGKKQKQAKRRIRTLWLDLFVFFYEDASTVGVFMN